MSKIFTIFLLIISSSAVYGQSFKCIAIDIDDPFVFNKSVNCVSAQPETNICLDLQINIVRRDDGSGGFDPVLLPTLVNSLNIAFGENNISFNYIGYKNINSTAYYDIDNSTESQNLWNTNFNPHSLTLYLVNSINGASGVAGTGFNRAVVDFFNENNVSNPLINTAIHELGHNLFLRHTHNNDSDNLENPDGSEACENGDFVIDTPPDPNLYNHVDNNCNYDNIIPGYSNPPTNNYMSYSTTNCRNQFTEGQEDRMIYGINNRSFLQGSVSQTCTSPSIIGDSTICNDEFYTYSISNLNDGVNAIWSVQNLLIINQDRNSITVKRLNSNTGVAKITANVNNIIKEFEIDLGLPTYLNQQIIGGSSNEPVNGFSQLNLSNPETRLYRWWIVTLNGNCANSNGIYPPGTILPKFQTGPNTYASEYFTTQSYVFINWGNCRGDYVVNVSAVNDCGERGLDHQTVNVYNPYNGDPCLEDDLVAYPNPSSGGEITVERIPADPCGQIPTLPRGSNANGNDSSTTNTQNRDGDISNLVEVVNLYGQIIFSETFDSDIFEITGLDNYVGTFIVKVTPLGEPPLTTTLLLE